jgi:nucleotide-binding universal stress UspA family protein
MAENELQATDAAEQAPTAPAEEVVKSIKGFSRDLTCMGFQFEIGKSYEAAGEIKACKNGFHAIEGHPLEVFDYYPPATSRYCETIQSGQLARHSDDSKIASAKITIGVEISISELTARAVKWVFDRAKWAGAPVATGDNEAATASGTRGAATASGDQGAATASGKTVVAIATGFEGKARGEPGSAICLVCRDDDGEIVAIRASKVGENGVAPGVWYSLDAEGNFVAVEDDE